MDHYIVAFTFVVGFIIMSASAVIWAFQGGSHLAEWYLEYLDKSVTNLLNIADDDDTYYRHVSTKVIALCDPFDEAMLWLSLHLRIARASALVLRLLTWLAIACIVVFMGGGFAGASLRGVEFIQASELIKPLVNVFIPYCMIGIAVSGGAACVLLLFSELVLSRLWSFGTLLPGAHFRWLLTVSYTPSSCKAVRFHKVCSKRGALWLKHCGYYDDDAIVATVVAEIESTLSEWRGPSQIAV